MERRILNALLDRYERSRHFRDGVSAQRIQVRIDKDTDFAGLQYDADTKELFFDALNSLKRDGLIDFSWVRYEKGNLAERFWLVPEEEYLKESYRRAKRTPRKKSLEEMEGLLEETIASMDQSTSEDQRHESGGMYEASMDRSTSEDQQHESGGMYEVSMDRSTSEDQQHKSDGVFEASTNRGDLRLFVERMLAEIREKKRMPRFFFDSKDASGGGKYTAGMEAERKEAAEKNRRLLCFIKELSQETGEEMERVISSRLYGDSKYFEHELKSRVLSILRAIAKEAGGDDMTDEELLAERGVVRWPEMLEFAGPIVIELDGGRTADFSALSCGAGISSETIRHLISVRGEVKSITSIENRANYVWYIANEREEGELVLYHGGFYSPVKGLWFKHISGAFPDVHCRHWSDIDLGGFRIFNRLRMDVFPNLVPWRMDKETVETFRDRCMPIENDLYRKELAALRTDERYKVFWDVIDFMLDTGLRLEQEAELW
jgi:hypothetical protein